MQWLRRSMSRQYSVMFLFALILYVLMTVFVLGNHLRSFSEEAIRENLRQEAGLAALETERFLNQYAAIAEQMATHHSFQSLAADVNTTAEKEVHPLYHDVVTQLQDIHAMNDMIHFAYIGIGGANDLIAHIPGYTPEEGFILSERDWYANTLASEEVWMSPPYTDFGTGETVVTFSAPLLSDHEQDPPGAVALDIFLADIQAELQTYGAGESGYVSLMDDTGTPLFHPEEAVLSGEETDPLLPIAAGTDPVNHAAFTEQDGHLIFAYSMDQNNWTVYAVIDEQEVNEPVSALLEQSFLLLMVVSAAIGGLMYFLNRSVTVPVQELSLAVKAYDREATGLEIPEPYLRRHDEIGTLANGLASMSSRIRHYVNTLTDKNRELEAEIHERTTIQTELELTLAILADSEDAFFVLDPAGKLLYANTAFFGLFDLNSSETANKSMDAFLDEEVVRHIHLSRNQQETEFHYRNMHLILSLSTMTYHGETYALGSLKDITASKKQQWEIQSLRFYDRFTGLFNKEHFLTLVNERLDLDQDNGGCLILINIDGFRTINEVKGLGTGNDIVLSLRDRIQNMKEHADILGRSGGDEFALFTDSPDITRFLAVLEGELSGLYPIGDEAFFVSVRMGIAAYSDDGRSAEELMGSAQAALNHVKQEPEKRYAFYNNTVSKAMSDEYRLLSQLRQGMEEEAFILHYQPQIDSQTGAIAGIEALIRWQVDGRFVPPDVFIPVAEKHRLIRPIGEWVLLEACRFTKTLFDQGMRIPVSVNVSPLQFQDPYLIDLVDRVLHETGLPAKLLSLEVTESLLMNQGVNAILDRLHERGIRVSIDDFGTGYSSLAYLKTFHVDQVKIDRSFIMDIPVKDEGMIAEVIIHLAKRLDLSVIAEGVETKEQLDFLREKGCDRIQGYYYYKPLSEADTQKLLLE